MFIRPEEVDRQFAWPPGRAKRLGKSGQLPHRILPDGEIRFVLSEISDTVVSAGPGHAEEQHEESEVSSNA